MSDKRNLFFSDDESSEEGQPLAQNGRAEEIKAPERKCSSS
jgi:hypothetical protein